MLLLNEFPPLPMLAWFGVQNHSRAPDWNNRMPSDVPQEADRPSFHEYVTSAVHSRVVAFQGFFGPFFP